MKSLISILTVFGSLTVIQPVFAQDSCEVLSTSKDVLTCALNNHPDLVRGKAALKQADSLEDKASQRPNPELNGQSVMGKSYGDNYIQNEINLAHTFEIGGKRSARIDKALAEKDQTSSRVLKTKEEVYISTFKTLYRIRQVHIEIKTLDEALETFAKIQRQFKLRPRLGPEQEVSLSIFQLAEGDYKIRRAALETEENSLERSIEIATGKEFPHSKESILPSRLEKWPDYPNKENEFKGSDIKLAQADLKTARADLDLAKSESWPDLKVGPSLQYQAQGPIQYWMYGVNFALPLPLFNINGGGRAVAAAGVSLAEQSLELRRRELSQARRILITQYQKASKSLKESVSLSEVDKKHRSVEHQFQRGVISSSLVIEAHRQMVDFTKNQNEQELTALEALWRLRAFEGALFDGDL